MLEGEFLITSRSAGLGEIVGEMSLVDSTPPSATVTAHGECLALFIDKALLMQKLENDVAFGCRFYKALSIFLADRLRAMSRATPINEHRISVETKPPQDELDAMILDTISSAGERFQRMLKILTGQP